jgi:hypothetical protein
MAALAVPATAQAKRDVPIGLHETANNPIRSDKDQLAIRFVLDEPTTMFRFISAFNLEGVYTDEAGRPAPREIRSRVVDKRSAPRSEGGNPEFPGPTALPGDWSEGSGRPGYSHGDGGVIHARLVEVRPDGTPDLSRVLAEERVNAVQRYRESKRVFGVSGSQKTQLLYFNTGSVPLAAGRMYAMVLSNASRDPYHQHFSVNSPATNNAAAGPHARNTLDPNAPGAMAGLDPRESVAWSTNGGQGWDWGVRVGGGNLFGYYTGSPVGDGGPKIPWYGWQASPGSRPRSNQPYYAYGEDGSYTLVARDAPRSVTLTEAGGFAPRGARVGAVTVRNLDTGAVGRTGSLGGGLARGRLDRPVRVAAGQSYSVTNSGTVAKAEADGFIENTFGVGGGEWPFSTRGHGNDRAELFAGPHPWHGPASPARVRIRARASRRGAASARSRRRVKVSVRGSVARPHLARAGRRVTIQVRSGRRWKRVGRVRLRRGRFSGRVRVRIARRTRSIRLRAHVPGVGRSAPARVRVR